MLTLFTTAKPFRSQNGIAQRNALRSWKLLHPEVDVIVFGNDEGVEEACRELGLRNEPFLDEGVLKTRRADFMFRRAQEISRHDLLCYSNCDIVLMSDFRRALVRVSGSCPKFLMVGRRWDVEMGAAIDFQSPDWEAKVCEHARRHGRRQSGGWIDYFAFTRDLYGADFPPLVVGRVYWDNWMIWRALQTACPVVDVSSMVMAVHQNHDYSHHPQGKKGIWGDHEATRNLVEIGGPSHLRAIGDATLILWPKSLKRNRARHWVALVRRAGAARRFIVITYWHPVWFFLLDVSRPLRTRLGLRKSARRQE